MVVQKCPAQFTADSSSSSSHSFLVKAVVNCLSTKRGHLGKVQAMDEELRLLKQASQWPFSERLLLYLFTLVFFAGPCLLSAVFAAAVVHAGQKN